jgi:translocation and assembly module TamB
VTRKRWWTLGLLTLALGCAIAGFTWWLIGTQGGARWGFERLSAAFPGELQVGQLRGPLRGPLAIRGLLYRTDRVEVRVDSLALAWRLRDLLAQRIDVRALEAFGVHVRLFAATAPAPPRDSLAAELPDFDLPLDLMVARAVLRDIEIVPADGARPLHIDEVVLRDGAFRDTVEIGGLALRSPKLDIDLAGRGRTRGRYAADMSLAWTYRPPGEAPIRGRGRWVGDLDTLRVVQSLAGGLTGAIDLVAYQPLRRLRFRGSVRFEDLELERVGVRWRDARADGDLAVAGSLSAFSAEGRIDPAAPGFGRWRGTVSATRDTFGVRVRRLALAQSGRNARLVARGVILTRGGAPRMDLNAAWTDLALPFDARAALESARGSARVTGTPDAYRLSGDATVATAGIPPSPVRFDGRGAADHIAFRAIEARTLGGTLTGRGVVDWRSAVGWRMDVRGRGLDPSAFHPALRGAVGFDAATRGRMGPGGPRGDVEVRALDGALRGQPLAGRASARFAPGSAAIPGLDLQWGPNRLVASGDVGWSWNLAWTVDAPVMSAVLPYGGGSLAMEGTVTGARRHPRLRSTLRADTLRWTDGRLQSLAGNADVDLGPGGTVGLDLEAQGLQSGTRQVDRAALAVRGTRDRHDVTLAGVAGADSLTLAARGGVDGRAWRGRLTKLDVVSRMLGVWALEREARLAAGPDGAALQDFCSRSGGGRLCAEAVWRRESGWTLDSRLEGLPLALLEPALPPAVDLTGPIDGFVNARGHAGRVVGEARLDLGPGTIAYPAGDRTANTALRASALHVVADPAGLDGHLALGLGSADSIHGRLRWPQPGNPGGAVAGDVHARLHDLAVVQALIPEISDPRGAFTADLRLAGTAARPRWSGAARLTQGSAHVPRAGIDLADVHLEAVADPGGHLRLDGGARSGGAVTLHGEAWLAPGGTPRAEATLSGQRFLAADTRDARVVASPDLTLGWRADSMRIGGEVVVPEADVSLRAAGRDPVVEPSSDVVFVVDTLSEIRPRAPLRVHSEVQLTLGRNVRVRGFGLDARPTGSVTAITAPGAPAIGVGELRVTSGSYRAYGQNLVIERGRLVYRHTPLANPELDVRAVRRARDGVVAGFEVQGSMAAPRFRVFSEPAMAERDALAYVVLGRKVERASELEQGILADAASSFGLEGGTFVAGSLARELGIQEASIQSAGAFEDASLMLGTYLSPRLYVNYGVGILDPISTLRIQYFLNNQWTLQAETGADRRAEVLYTVER